MSIDDNNDNVPIKGKRKTDRELQRELMQMRRDKCLELYMAGKSETEISKILHVSQPTVSLDLKAIKENNKVTIQNIISELPLAWAKARKALQHIQTEALSIANHERTNVPQKLAALVLFKDSQESEFELMTNSEILNDAFRYVEAHSQTLDNIQKVLSNRDKQNKEEPKDEDLVEEEIQCDLHTSLSEHSEDT